MWVGHYAPGLMAKPFVPNVPLWVLSLAGAFPDALHFALNFVHVESFNFDPTLVSRGCFPYTNDYPFSHSMTGIIIAGVAFVVCYTVLTDRKVTIKDQIFIFLTVFSHFVLELPVHRTDIKITPYDHENIGASLFDHALLTFLVESALVLLGYSVWNVFSPGFAKAGALKNPQLPKMVLAFLIIQQAFFCWGAAPTANSKYIHASIFLGEILLTSYILGKLN